MTIPASANDAGATVSFARLIAPAVALAAVGAAADLIWDAGVDVSWTLSIAERMLDGQTPYVDFIEANPPASIYLYVPPVMLARFLGATPEAMTVALSLLFGSACIGLTALVLRGAGLSKAFGRYAITLAATVFFVGPGRMFAQRDVLVVEAILPYLAILLARAERRSVAPPLALLVGLVAGVGLAVKPHYALCLVLPALVTARRAGLRAALLGAEPFAAVAVVAAYATLVVVKYPIFVHEMLPMMSAAYVPVRESLKFLLFQPAGLATLCLGGVFVTDKESRESVPAAMLAMAALGAFAVYLMQGKGWPYQAYPALALLVVATLIGRAERSDRGAWFVAVAAAGAALAGLYEGPEGRGTMLIEAALAAAYGASVFAQRFAGLGAPSVSARDVAIGGASGVGFALMALGQTHDPLEGAVAMLGPHPSIAAITGELGAGFPLTRHVHGVWAQRVGSLYITEGVVRLLRAHPGDEALKARLMPFMLADRDRLVEDIRRNQPDAILVSGGARNVIPFAESDPQVIASLSDYERIGEVADEKRSTTLFARRDLVEQMKAEREGYKLRE